MYDICLCQLFLRKISSVYAVHTGDCKLFPRIGLFLQIISTLWNGQQNLGLFAYLSCGWNIHRYTMVNIAYSLKSDITRNNFSNIWLIHTCKQTTKYTRNPQLFIQDGNTQAFNVKHAILYTIFFQLLKIWKLMPILISLAGNLNVRNAIF